MFDSCLVQEFLHKVLSTSLFLNVVPEILTQWTCGDEGPVRELGVIELTLGTLGL